MKQTKLWLITIAALLCSITASAHDFEVDGIYYNVTSSANLTVSVTYKGNSYSSYSNEYNGAVIIPSTATYNSITYSVTSIGNYAFRGCSSLTSITIPEVVTSIGSSAFEGCTSLDTITLSEKSQLKSIGNYAFEGCSSLTSITIPEGVTSIGNYAFEGCSSLTSITIPEGVTSIGYNAFKGCSSLTSITIPEGVTSIGYSAFYGCSNLTSITIPEGVTSIGQSTFSGCSSLTSITIPEGVTSIGDYAFYNCSNLTSITIPEGVTSIGSSAFYNCSNLTSIIIPESVTSIGSSAFEDCSSLTSITIPEGVTSIGEYSFAWCSSLTSITIPEGVTSIGDYAFRGCSSLTAITLPEGVTSIGSSAFYGCSKLYKVINYSKLSISKGSSDYGYVAYYAKLVINGNDLITVGDFQFYISNDTYYLVNYIGQESDIVLPDDYNGMSYNIGECAFYSCSSLTSITIPEGVTSIGNYTFSFCTALKEVIFEDGSEALSLGRNGSIGLFYDCPLESVYLGRNLSYATGPNNGYSPFYNKDMLSSVKIGGKVTAITDYAFYDCDNIPSLTIHSGVLSIGNKAFDIPKKVIWLTNTPPTGYANAKGSINYVANDQYTSLSNTKVYPYLSSMFEVDGVKYVPVSPSERTCHAIDCTYDDAVTTINVGETTSFKGVAMKVTEVLPYTFYGNNHIKEVEVSHLGNIGDCAFCDCDSIKHMRVSNNGDIGLQAFYNCDAIETVTISNQGNIGEQAFYNCDAIETVTISNQGNIGEQAFCDCNGIKTIDVRSQGIIGNQAFYGCNGMERANVAIVGAIGSEAFFDCSALKMVTLGDEVSSLGDKAFSQCVNLQEFTIPNSVKTIGTFCFCDCSAMEKIVLGEGVTSIDNNTFAGCSDLKEIIWGSNVSVVNNNAFNNCIALTELTIPQTITKIGDYAFSGCSQLADIIIEDRSTTLNLGSNGSSALFADCPLDSVYIGGKITYNTTSSRGNSPFCRNNSLRSVVIADHEEQIYDNEFYGCTNLQNVTIGNGVKSIGDYAFSGCSSLEGFSFGSNMETIGAEAFSDCNNLTTITSHAAVPPICGTQALDDINKWSCTLRVPSGYAAAYQAADQWKEFFFIEDVVEVELYVLTYVVDGEVYHTDTLAHKATIAQPEMPVKEGYTFNGWSEIPATMPANDVTISGTFTINKYLVTFQIGEEVVAVDSLEYGATIAVPEAPEKEGYTFDGWGEVADIVPAYDVTYEGTYTVNVYKVYYYVGEELVYTAEVAYGESIPEYVYEPTAEGDVFEGWVGETYGTMPAHDVTYTANITNGIGKSEIKNEKLEIIYDLQGRRVLSTDNLKGIYIINGKRVVIK